MIISVQYRNDETHEFTGRGYNYYCGIPVDVGDIVIAPTSKGSSIARVYEIDVPESNVDERILPKLKTISSLAEQEAQQ